MVDTLTQDVIRRERLRAEGMIRDAERMTAEARAILEDLDAVARVMSRVGGEGAEGSPILRAIAASSDISTNRAPTHAGGGAGFSIRNPFKAGTNKAFIWEVLDTAHTIWLNANQIQERASELKGEDIPMSSISPMLSEMKDTYLERDGMLVALKERVPAKEAQDEQ
ncbi:hypothetical protein [Sphingopyxis sp.]|uniref:hypothetical protein n=1 Tax=Sphingopyxis sp. TaxID=1908224 RepID=UPI002D78DDF7|nr:hypothetical protein [Sphingopyxis sp.]HET6525176.1 hypothetical protein [Sphingopyxis sp.]